MHDASVNRVSEIEADAETGAAEADLDRAARNRVGNILANGITGAAEGALNRTARPRVGNITGQGIVGAAEGALNRTARSRSADIVARAILGAAEGALNSLTRPRTVAITGIFGGARGALPGFASGTNYAPGGLAEVAERGAELIEGPGGGQVIALPRGSKVRDAGATRRALHGSVAGGPLNADTPAPVVNVQVLLDGQVIDSRAKVVVRNELRDRDARVRAGRRH